MSAEKGLNGIFLRCYDFLSKFIHTRRLGRAQGLHRYAAHPVLYVVSRSLVIAGQFSPPVATFNMRDLWTVLHSYALDFVATCCSLPLATMSRNVWLPTYAVEMKVLTMLIPSGATECYIPLTNICVDDLELHVIHYYRQT